MFSKDTLKLDKSDLYNTFLAVFFGWSFDVIINFWTIVRCSAQELPYLGWIETLPAPWNSSNFSVILLFEIPSSLAIAYCFIFLSIFTIFILISPIFYVRIYSILKKQLVPLRENICIFVVEYISALKHYLNRFIWRGKNLLHSHLSRSYASSLFNQNLNYKISLFGTWISSTSSIISQ